MSCRDKEFFEGDMENLRRKEHGTGATITEATGPDWSE
jgi:hypothetical protein